MRYFNNKVIPSSAMNATVASAAIPATNLFATSAQFIVSGLTTGSGNVKLQASNDYTAPTNWSDLSSTAVTGNNTYMISKVELCYQWIRYVYVPTVNDAGGTVQCNAQSVGV